MDGKVPKQNGTKAFRHFRHPSWADESKNDEHNFGEFPYVLTNIIMLKEIDVDNP